jgi:hypothetical protein
MSSWLWFHSSFFHAIDDEDEADGVQGDGVDYGVHVSSDAATDGVQVPLVQGDAALDMMQMKIAHLMVR